MLLCRYLWYVAHSFAASIMTRGLSVCGLPLSAHAEHHWLWPPILWCLLKHFTNALVAVDPDVVSCSNAEWELQG